MDTVSTAQIEVDEGLRAFVDAEAIPGTGVGAADFWDGFARIVEDFAPRNEALLARRAELQQQIDAWHAGHRGKATDTGEYVRFLSDIGYLTPAPPPFEVRNGQVDDEVSRVPGPQLVVPATNARYALNAANARWGSLYDALYGTNAVSDEGGAARGTEFNPVRGERVIQRVRAFLDEAVPLAAGSHADVRTYRVENAALIAGMGNGTTAGLKDPAAFAGYRGTPDAPSSILLVHNGLHIELVIDRGHHIGRTDAAGIADVIVEAALSTIVDGEDSVAAVDAEDKVRIYRNWLGLMKGTLAARFEKDGEAVDRTLAGDRSYTTPDGAPKILHGRSLLLVRNVGHHMMTDIVRTEGGRPIPETILDAAVTVLIALHDLRGGGPLRNSRAGAIYVVRPKMHSADEVAFSVALFDRIEDLLRLPRGTVKIGVMDEERRLSANLAAAIHAARERVFFINTGFLDRTGDEIHTIMEAGPVVTKAAMRGEAWIKTYESNNVQAGLDAALDGRGQIGKGMWTQPDLMAEMLAQKIAHPQAGATTAWVPSPTAAVLHALHYHAVDVRHRQEELRKGRPADTRDLFALPLLKENLSPKDVERELENNLQSILGYVVRWVDQGVGCSKVPDINGIGLMEDRATLRISSQHVANWLRHDIVSPELVESTLRRMAEVVDRQNKNDAAYRSMAPGFDGPAFRAAHELVFQGRMQPRGYTEDILHARRRERKALDRAGKR